MLIPAEVYNRVHAAASSRLQRLAGGRFADRCLPFDISIAMTARCNARCVHCNIWRQKGREEVIPLDAWRSVLRELRDWLGPVHVTITGGEALLRPHTPDVVAFGSSIGLLVEHLTHGYWRDQTRVEALARANPWRITMSLDGIGEAHDTVRGRAGFFDVAMRSLDTIRRVGEEQGRSIPVRFKAVIMQHNLHDLANIARFAEGSDCDVLYQPIVQNYASEEDPTWYLRSANWPKDRTAAVAAVRELIELKQAGYPIANTVAHLEGMIAYFSDPDAQRLAAQHHAASSAAVSCSAAGGLAIAANGDVRGCQSKPAYGNILQDSIRSIWRRRPQYWRTGCCMSEQASGGLPG